MTKTSTKTKTARKARSETHAKKTPVAAKKPTKRAVPVRSKATKATQAAAPANTRPETKQGLLIAQLRRKEGATIAELVRATGWQAHSIRGAISGTLKRKLGLAVDSKADETRGRVYRIVAGG